KEKEEKKEKRMLQWRRNELKRTCSKSSNHPNNVSESFFSFFVVQCGIESFCAKRTSNRRQNKANFCRELNEFIIRGLNMMQIEFLRFFDLSIDESCRGKQCLICSAN